MALEDISSGVAVRAAIQEWNDVGAAAMRAKYGTAASKRYFLVDKGQSYDVKTIAAAAHRAEFPKKPIFSGTQFHTQRAVKNLHRLGFEVFVSSIAATIERERSAIAEELTFDPEDKKDGRTRTLTSIVRRQGQGQFRAQVLKAYKRRCAVSDCDAVQALDAAHIVPYRGPSTNHVTNGLLLRTDLHTLFDLRLMTVDPASMTVQLSQKLHGSQYGPFHGKKLRLPAVRGMRPNRKALAEHFRESDMGGA